MTREDDFSLESSKLKIKMKNPALHLSVGVFLICFLLFTALIYYDNYMLQYQHWIDYSHEPKQH